MYHCWLKCMGLASGDDEQEHFSCEGFSYFSLLIIYIMFRVSKQLYFIFCSRSSITLNLFYILFQGKENHKIPESCYSKLEYLNITVLITSEITSKITLHRELIKQRNGKLFP